MAKKSIFSIHQITLYNRTDGTPYGTLEVLEGSTLALEGELVELQGGSNPYSWAVEQGAITSEMAVQFSEYPNWLLRILWAATVTLNAAEPLGATAGFANVKGTSVLEATDGIDSIDVLTGSEANLKSSEYIVKASGTDTVTFYMFNTSDQSRGVDVTVNDDMSIVEATDIVVPPLGATVDIIELGLQITGGSAAAVVFVADDTAEIVVRAPNTGSEEVVVGQKGAVFEEFGAIVVAQKSGSLELTSFNCFRCKAAGAPVGMTRAAFSQSDVTVKMIYDDVKNKLFTMSRIQES